MGSTAAGASLHLHVLYITSPWQKLLALASMPQADCAPGREHMHILLRGLGGLLPRHQQTLQPQPGWVWDGGAPADSAGGISG